MKATDFRSTNFKISKRSLYGITVVLIMILWSIVSGYASTVTIKGKVVEVKADIKIEHEGKWAPKLEDPVEIGFKLGDDFIPVEGDWKIVLVKHKYVWAKNKGTAGEKPAVGYLVNIQSKNPLIREKLIPPKPDIDEKTNAFTGKWNTNFGVLEISIQGNKFTGHYPHDKGRIGGDVSKDGTKLIGYWSEAPSYKAPKDRGKLLFKLNPDKKSFQGVWAYGDKQPSQEWKGTRID